MKEMNDERKQILTLHTELDRSAYSRVKKTYGVHPHLGVSMHVGIQLAFHTTYDFIAGHSTISHLI